MKLIDVKECKNFEYISCADKFMEKQLKTYGFLKGVSLEVESYNKKNFVVKILGSKYTLNKRLAETIEVARRD